MKFNKQRQIVLSAAVAIIIAIVLIGMNTSEEDVQVKTPSPHVLSVATTVVTEAMLPLQVPATGSIVPWQEASIGAEGEGLRLIDVTVNVGDTVKRGQVLALFYSDIVAAELAEAKAAVTQADAEVMEATANAQRAKSLDRTGALSAQQINQYLVAEMTAKARLDAMRAAENRQRLRLNQTRVLAPNDGIITSRSATVGTVVPAGQELFRLIENGRLEWRAVIASTDILALRPGQIASVTVQGHESIQGTLRIVAPTIDAGTHNGLVYVDLPQHPSLRAGIFARGYFNVGEARTITLPQRAVILRDGFNYVMQVGPNSSVTMKKVSVGRQIGERIEITAGLTAAETVIASGLNFLSEGDTVRVVNELPSSAGSKAQARNSATPTAASQE